MKLKSKKLLQKKILLSSIQTGRGIDSWIKGCVVSIDLFLTFYMPFSYNGVYFRPAQVFYPIPPPPHTFWVPKVLFNMLKHNFPSWMLGSYIASHVYLLYSVRLHHLNKEWNNFVQFLSESLSGKLVAWTPTEQWTFANGYKAQDWVSILHLVRKGHKGTAN